ncbi:MAG TPA: NAD-dependent epimerase/dehydratase family protein, partial [Candidatus Angelobacter sp.]|nr:NAD-dependent epimerase/dehydratase family protein [Candidatus Angelobacter sp.]
GQTRDDLPEEVERLRGDRTNPTQLKQVLGGREFDLVVDTTLYTGAEAEAVVDLFANRVGRYIFLSTGQVYLVRIGVERPFKEEDYAGPVMAEPSKSDVSNHGNWLYGFDKRAAEDVFARAWLQQKFPYTSLRLPMVNSERDSHERIYGYFLRLLDGGPILIPEGAGLPVRHVYGEDVVQAIMKLTTGEVGEGSAYNIGQDETLTLDQFLEMLAETVHRELNLLRVSRETLEREGLLPDCSPFSGLWMSSIENAHSKAELGMRYTPVSTYLKKLVSYFQAIPTKKIEGYAQRANELKLAQTK